MILTDGIVADIPKFAPDYDSLLAGAPPARLIDPQRVYAESMRDAARRQILVKNPYGTRDESPHHLQESTGATLGP